MLKKCIIVLVCLLVGFSFSVQAFAGASDDAEGTYQDSDYFDGGSGSTLHTGSNSSYSSDVPDIGEAGPVEN